MTRPIPLSLLKEIWEEDDILEESALDSAQSTFLDAFYATRFVALMAKDFVEWDAFKAGVIDDKGNILVKTGNRTRDQRKTFTHFHRLVWNLKRLLNRVAPSKIASILAAGKLIMESNVPDDMKDGLVSLMESTLLTTNYITADQMGELYRQKHQMSEEAPSTSTTGIAGYPVPLFRGRLNKGSGPIRRRFEDLKRG